MPRVNYSQSAVNCKALERGELTAAAPVRLIVVGNSGVDCSIRGGFEGCRGREWRLEGFLSILGLILDHHYHLEDLQT